MFTGDVVGRSGRKAFADYTRRLRQEKHIDLVIVNGENASGGKGLTRKGLDALYNSGADIITSGNHIWDKREVLDFIDDEPFLIRPANYPGEAPGKGWCIYPFKSKNIGVINLCGRAFMPPVDCPFQKIEDILHEIKDECDVILLDFHAETTSEKIAMGWYLDGRIASMVGTHTHVQTADECILPKGTGYISDLGMTGPWHSVLGVKTDLIMERFTTCRPVRFDVADGPNIYSAVIMDIDENANRTTAIERVMIRE